MLTSKQKYDVPKWRNDWNIPADSPKPKFADVPKTDCLSEYLQADHCPKIVFNEKFAGEALNLDPRYTKMNFPRFHGKEEDQAA